MRCGFPIDVPSLSDMAEPIRNVVLPIVESATSCSSPFLLHMLGIPGAGKSSFLQELHKNFPAPKPAIIGFDQIMVSLPGYKSANDKRKAFEEWELPARAAGYWTLREMMQKKAHILFDNGGSAASHIDLLRYAHGEKGYKIAIVHVLAPPQIARERILKRFLETGRYTPHEYLEDRAQKITALYTDYKNLTPRFYEIENTGNGEEDKKRFTAATKETARAVSSLIQSEPH